jgi:hypothetical protein
VEIEKVEDIANDFVLQNSPVTTRLMALDDARASGARALFGEKYGDEVRVVAMGEDLSRAGSSNMLGWSVDDWLRPGFWRERVHPKKPKVRNPKVLALRTASLDDKEFLLASRPEWFFTEAHYNGYPAVLLRLDLVTATQLRPLLKEAWRTQAPKELQEPPRSARSTTRPKRPRS